MTKCCVCKDAATHYCIVCEDSFCERHAEEHRKATASLLPIEANMIKIGENPDAKTN
jgi:hypothetical protein